MTFDWKEKKTQLEGTQKSKGKVRRRSKLLNDRRNTKGKQRFKNNEQQSRRREEKKTVEGDTV